MKHPIQLSNPIPALRMVTIRPSRRRGLLVVPFFVACLALSLTARAVDPPPDGGYPNNNTAEGEDALFSLTSGVSNTASGFDALYSTTIGGSNTAVGWQALFSNTRGYTNTAIGSNALYNNTTGGNNTGCGVQALLQNTTGENNTAHGNSALYDNTTGSLNTALGADSMVRNKSGIENTATGFDALQNNTTGSYNTATGFAALGANKKGNYNIALGFAAGFYRQRGSNNIDIGSPGVRDESGAIRIGKRTQTNTYIAGITGVTVATGVGVIIDSTGHLGTITSSARFKENIQPMAKASEAILALQPVTFHYKKELDPAGVSQFGLVAEQVEKVDPDLVARDEAGKAYTVRYEAVNAMLLNEFLKAHRKLEEQAQINQRQEATIARQKKDFDQAIAQHRKEILALTATLEAQAAQIHEVSIGLAKEKAAPRVASLAR